jgi:ABC-type arginine transport system permease subunit
MLGLSVLLVLVIVYSATTGILYNNGGILQEIGNYTGDDGQIDPDFFVFQMSMISLLYGAIISTVYSFGLKLISINNSRNPF